MSPENVFEPVRKTVEVSCEPARAFQIFTDEMESWWPLATHSIGQEQSEACYFEGRNGGRIFETHNDGSIHLWGTVTVWEPPSRVIFAWHPGRDAATAQEVELRFESAGGGTRIELEHRGWEILGDEAEEIRDGYETGWVPVLARYVESCS